MVGRFLDEYVLQRSLRTISTTDRVWFCARIEDEYVSRISRRGEYAVMHWRGGSSCTDGGRSPSSTLNFSLDYTTDSYFSGYMRHE